MYFVNEVVTGQPRFIIDSGTTMTLVKDRYVLHDYREFASPYYIKAANGECIDVRGEGTLILEDANYKIQIHKVGYVPKLMHNLINPRDLLRANEHYVFTKDSIVHNTMGVIGRGTDLIECTSNVVYPLTPVSLALIPNSRFLQLHEA